MNIILFDNTFMNPLFDLLEDCQGVKQNEEHHPEIYVLEHSLQVLRRAFRESIDTDLILAAMLRNYYGRG